MGYTFARVGAAVHMKVEDFYIQKRRGWVRLHEKGGKCNGLPCHHIRKLRSTSGWALQAWLPSRPLRCSQRSGMES